jgi:hypothetical protein
MKAYNKTGVIDSWGDIPWNKPVVVTGVIGRNAWMWRMSGVFENNDGNAWFMDEHGMATHFDENDLISLNMITLAEVEA